MKEEPTELKGKTDPYGTKRFSDDKGTIINHADPPVDTDAEKLAYFNDNYPIYDNQQIEITGIVTKKFDKTSTVFNRIDHGLRTAHKRQKHEDMIRSLRISYPGKHNKRLIQNLNFCR